MVRAKLTGTWEGGGIVGEKTYKQIICLLRGTFLPLPPWGIGLTSISHLIRGPYTQFPIMEKLHLTCCAFSITITGKKVCGGKNGGSGGGKLCKLTLVISLSLSQAEQLLRNIFQCRDLHSLTLLTKLTDKADSRNILSERLSASADFFLGTS